MRIPFQKYQATGNDFVLIDNRKDNRKFSTDKIKKICDRRFGIGADGLILIEQADSVDFKMVYYNSDGSQSLCGNGCRSAVNFASALNIVKQDTTFEAFDGPHQATIMDDHVVRLKMSDVNQVTHLNGDFFINTGSPHFIRFVTHLDKVDVVEQGSNIRNSDIFKPEGCNANFVELLDDNTIAVRTYERGVEDETLSCGTGVTAAALAASFKGYFSPLAVQVKGGSLLVEFESSPEPATLTDHGVVPASFSNIFLIGPAKMVFEGVLEL